MSLIAKRQSKLDNKILCVEQMEDGSICLHIYLETTDRSKKFTIKFSNNDSSSYTYRALRQLFHAIRLDNERDMDGWIDASFVMHFNGGITCTSDARVHPVTKEVDILSCVSVESLDTPERLFVVFPDSSEVDAEYDDEGNLRLVES